jgi:hypothetical protein
MQPDMSLSEQLEALTNQVLQGESQAALKTSMTALMKSEMDADDLVSIFKVLPRSLTFPHIDRFLDAESNFTAAEVSTLLINDDFVGCEPLDTPAFAKVASTVVNRLTGESHAASAPAVYRWRLDICSKSAEGIDVDQHAQAAIVYALNSPSMYQFEPLADVVSSSSFKATTPKTKQLIEFLVSVMLEGTGATGVKAFEAKAGKQFLPEVGVTDALRKARITSLCTALLDKKSISFADVNKTLLLDNVEDVESYVIDAALAGIIDVKVNRNDRVVDVKSVTPLKFDAAAWKQLREQIVRAQKFADGMAQDYRI